STSKSTVKDLPQFLHDTLRPRKLSGVRYLHSHEGHIVILLLFFVMFISTLIWDMNNQASIFLL
ncbi:MAG: hypothetical protein ACWGNI_04910, partial [Desulfobacterales bacterium]